MKRLYFLLPNVETARGLVHELLLNHVKKRKIHIVAREEMPLGDLPEASSAQTSDLLPAVKQGMALGGITGVIAGLVAVMAVPMGGLTLGSGVIPVMAVGGAVVGAWVSSMIGISLASSRLDKFQQALDAGQILMLVDVPKHRVEEIQKLIRTSLHASPAQVESG